MLIKRLIAVLAFFVLSLISPLSAAAAPAWVPHTQAESPMDPRLTDQILQSVRAAIASRPSASGLNPGQFAIIQTFPSSDQTRAVLWLANLAPQTGEPVASEPVLAIIQGLDPANPADTSQIKVTFQNDSDWSTAAQGLPVELQKNIVQEDASLPRSGQKGIAAAVIYGGYYLPWANGLTKHLSMGAHHTSCPTTCTYAFDFADGTMFPLLAAKGGTVYYWKDTCQNNDHSCTNSLALEDRSTSPYTYQIYLHLAQNSISPSLKTFGKTVQQGDFIANVDNTGYSTGHHVHFMVVTNPYLSTSGYYWGYSVDITFRDVSINWDPGTKGGRPCLSTDIGYGHCTQWQYDYTSGNHGTHPPSGDMILPDNFITVDSPTVRVGGWGTDDLSVTRMQILANYDGTWKEVGPSQILSPFTYDLDLCAANIPDGPVTLALKVYDYEGNQTPLLGLRNIVKTFSCTNPPPPPPCIANANQVALFANSNFSGSCQVFGVGSYPNAASLGKVGGVNAESIQIGANVSATLFSGENYTRRGETFYSSKYPDPLNIRDLASHLIGSNQAASLRVQARTDTPAAPILNAVANQVNTSPTSNDSLVLSWNNGGGAYKFQAALYNRAGAACTDANPYKKTAGFSLDQSWSVGNLPAGAYTWCVQGRSSDTYTVSYFSPWVSAAFTVNPAVPISGSTWTASGLWRQATLPALSGSGTINAWTFNNTSSNYAGDQVRAGDLTSPPFVLPALPAISYLRYTYQYQTESPNPFFDQRQVQISVDGGPFQDLGSALKDDLMQTWLGSPAIDLSAYAGKTIRIRFHFDIIDSNLNTFFGWAVQNVEVNTVAPPSCPESQPNNSTSTAVQITYGASIDGQICPAGDVDYYKFSGRSGDLVQVDAVASGLNPPSPLDTTLTLLDSDGQSVLAYNDDIQPGTNSDSRISFKLPADCLSGCSYYLKLSAWDFPGGGSLDHNYRLTITQKTASGVPSISFILPGPGGYIPNNPFPLTVQVADSEGGNGISHIDFFVHSPDWLDGKWTLIGTDWSSTDGWAVTYNPTPTWGQAPYSVYARVYDWTGSTAVALRWAMPFDTLPPHTTLADLPPTSTSTAVRLYFSGSDAESALDHYDLQYTDNGSGWVNYPRSIPATQNRFWFVGQSGHSYSFQIRGVDQAGNAEAFHSAAKSSVLIQAICAEDSFESDNVQSEASLAVIDAPAQSHNFCSLGDMDWVMFPAIRGDTYTFMIIPTPDSPAAPEVALFDANGSAVPGVIAIPPNLGTPSSLKWTVDKDGVYYLRLRSIDPNVGGSGVSYTLWVGHGTWIYFPRISR